MGNQKLRTTTKRKTVLRPCLGPLAVKKPHMFASPAAGERMCKRCRRALAGIGLAPVLERPVRVSEVFDE